MLLAVIPVDSPGPELGLRDYAKTLWQRKWIIVLTTVVATLVAAVVSVLQHPVYEGTAKVLAQPSLVQTVLNPSSSALESVLVATDVQLFSGGQVQAAVRATLGSTPPVTPSEVGTTGIINLVARSSSPAQAAAVANAYANAFVQVSQASNQKDLSIAVAQLTGQLNGLKAQIAKTGSATQRANLVDQQSTLQVERATLQENAAVSGEGVILEASATPNPNRVSPKRARDVGLGFVVGLLVGIGFAFLRQYLDDSVSTREDVDRATGGLANLGEIPLVRDWKDPEIPMVASVSEPASAAAEAYRSLRTAIQFAGLDNALVTIQVTSAKPGEGKTTTVANLAAALAKSGQRVAVVSCDLRRPRIHAFFGVANDIGFTSVALGSITLGDALQPSPFDDRILVLASGPIPPNPSELLASNRALDILTELSTMVDVVLVDSPPVLPVTDASVLARRVDGTILVATAGTTTRKDLAKALDALRRVGAPMLGTILNSVKVGGGYAEYAYGDESGYGYSYRPVAPVLSPGLRSPHSGGRFGGAVRRRAPLLLATVVVAALIGWFATPGTGKYQVKAIVGLGSAAPSVLGNQADVSALESQVDSNLVIGLGLNDAGLALSMSSVLSELRVTAQAGSPLVTLTVSDANPVVAESLANGMATALVSTLGSPKSASVGVAPSVISRASLATVPESSHAGVNAAWAAIAGLIVSGALSLGLERRRGMIRSASDVERRLRLPVLGALSSQPMGLAVVTRPAKRVKVGNRA